MDNFQEEFIIENLEVTLILNYADFGVLAFLLYDTALVFSSEVEYFWKPPKKATSYLYFITRYIGILIPILLLLVNKSDADDKICNLMYLTEIFEPVLILCIDYILLLRVRALHSRERAVSIILATAFAIEVITLAALEIQGALVSHPRPVNIATGLTFCTESVSSLIEDVASWSIPLVYGILLMALAVYKAAALMKEDPLLGMTRLTQIIIRDQVVYFMALILVSMGGILENFIPPSTPVLVLSESLGNPAILSSVGARLLLNMKEASAKGLNEGMGSSVDRGAASGIEFVVPTAQSFTISSVHEEIEMAGA